MLCKNCYEKIYYKTDKTMLFCKLKDNNEADLFNLCTSQKFCTEKNKYIATEQNKNCKYFK